LILSDERKRIIIPDGAQAVEISTQAFLRMADRFLCNMVQFGLAIAGMKCAGQSFNGINNKLNSVDEFDCVSMNETNNGSVVKICTTSAPYL
jgi:hypothetical protein